MADRFEKNLACLNRVDPRTAALLPSQETGDSIEWHLSRCGSPTLKVEGRYFHSAYNPLEEARHFAGRGIKKVALSGHGAIGVFGLGLGYHVRELLKSGLPLIVVEPRLDVFKAAMEAVDLRDVLTGARLVLGERWNYFVEMGEFVRKGMTVLVHKPSGEGASQVLERFMCHVKMKEPGQGPKRLFFVFPLEGATLPIARYCVRALQELRCEVSCFDSSLFCREARMVKEKGESLDRYMHELSEKILRAIRASRPEYVIALSQSPLNRTALFRLREEGVKTACWFLEDHRNARYEYWQGVAPLYDCFFTIQDQQSGIFERLQSIGVRRCHHLPGAASTGIHRPLRLDERARGEMGAHLALLGVHYPSRSKILSGLTQYHPKIWGTGWDLNSPLGPLVQRGGSWIPEGDAVKVYNATKINLNTHYSCHGQRLDPEGGYINPRTFEIAACSAFQIMDFRKGVDAYFEPGEEVDCFHDLESLKSHIDYYLTHPEERLEMGLRCRKRVLREHTYRHRMREMLAFMALNGWAGGKGVWRFHGKGIRNRALESQ